MDETYRKAGKMDTDHFSTSLEPYHTELIKIVRTYLLEGTDSARKIKVELYKFNVYSMCLVQNRAYHRLTRSRCPGKGSFFKSHVDTPRNEKMFGSLVITFPTPHEGGALLLRHRGQEWTFDSATALSISQPSSIAYAAFFSDIEHEVLPVTSGHRVTLTYNLYFDDDVGPSAKDLVSEPPSAPQEENERVFRSAFKALLNNPAFLPDGGTLVFGMRHVYQVEDKVDYVYSLLKGSDAAVYQTLRALGFEPVLYLYYDRDQPYGELDSAVLLDKVPNFQREVGVSNLTNTLLRDYGGIRTQYEEVIWVTPVTTFNRRESTYIACTNESSLSSTYGDVCLVARVGKIGERLEYQTAMELEEKQEQERPRLW